MTSQTSAPTALPETLLQRIRLWLTGSNRNAVTCKNLRQQPQAVEVRVVSPFLPPTVFIDYAAEGDEPADLALTELIPDGLRSLNLPHCRAQASETLIDNTCALAIRLPVEPETEEDIAAAELAELIPLELSNLDRTFGQLTKQADSSPLPNLENLKRTQKGACLDSNEKIVCGPKTQKSRTQKSKAQSQERLYAS